MKKVFEHPAAHEVGHYESILRGHGISTFIKNRDGSMRNGERSLVSAFPELWVVDDEDFERALDVLKEFRRNRTDRPDWTCSECGEKVSGSSEECWNCRTEGGPRRDYGRLAESEAPEAPASVSDIYPLTIGVMVVAVLAFLWRQADSSAAGILAPSGVAIYGGRWDGLIGAVLVHSGFFHLAFNLYWIWAFGSVIERHMGWRLWGVLFLLSAAFGSAVELAVFGETGWGLSGVVFGFFGFLYFARPGHPAFGATLPRTVIVVLMGWLLVGIGLTLFKVLSFANGAHIGGLVAGSILGLAADHSRRAVAWAEAALAGVAILSVAWAPWSNGYLGAHATRLLEAKRTTEAFPILERIADSGGRLGTWAATVAAAHHRAEGNFAAAAAAYESVIEATHHDVDYLKGYAWLLATAPPIAVRDGKKAVRLALRAAELTAWQDAEVMATLAAACAEAGDFAAAVKWQTVAMDLGHEGRDRIGHYLEQRPFRDVAPTPRAE